LYPYLDDQHRLFLVTPAKERTNYINAVYVHVSIIATDPHYLLKYVCKQHA